VTFGPGPIGIFAMQIAKAMGSQTIMSDAASVSRPVQARRGPLVDYEGGHGMSWRPCGIKGASGPTKSRVCGDAGGGHPVRALRQEERPGRLRVALPRPTRCSSRSKTMVMNRSACTLPGEPELLGEGPRTDVPGQDHAKGHDHASVLHR